METKVSPPTKEYSQAYYRGMDQATPLQEVIPVSPQAMEEYHMLRDGDRVLVCLSGGKDSLSLLHTLWQYRFLSKAKGVNFTIGAVTVDPGSASYNPRPLIPYLAALGVPYFYEEQGTLHIIHMLQSVLL